MSGEFSFSKENMSIKNITIDSESIKGSADIGLKMNFGDTSKNSEWKITTNINKFDLDKLFAKGANASSEVESSEIDYYNSSLNRFSLNDFRFNLPKSFTATLEMRIDDVLYKQKISNFRVFVDIDRGNAVIKDLSADFPGDSRLVIKGSISHNGIRPLFIGDVEFGGSRLGELVEWFDSYYNFIPQDKMKEFLFTSKLRVTPQQIDITDVSLSVDKSLLSGEFSIRPVKTVPLVNAIVNIDRMNLDEYNFDKMIFKEVNKFVEETQGSMLEHSWLSDFSNQLNITLNAKDIVFNNTYVKNHFTSLMVSRGLFNLQRFVIDSEASKLALALFVDLKTDETKPKLKLLFKSEMLDTAFFLQKDSLYKNVQKKFSWSKAPMNFMKAGDFFGEVDIDIDELKHKDIVASKIKIKGELTNGKFDFSRQTNNSYGISFSLYDGNFLLDGNMIAIESRPAVAGTFSISGVEIGPMLKTVKETDIVSGQLFSKGAFHTKGLSFHDWVINLKTKANVALQSFRFTGFDLSRIIDKASTTYSFIDMKEVLDIASKSGDTKFELIQGNFESENGILKTKDVKLLHDYAAGSAQANISLMNSDTKSLVKMTFKPLPKKEVTLPITMNGYLLDLKAKIDTRNLESYITDKGVR